MQQKREPLHYLAIFFIYLAAAAVGLLAMYYLPLSTWLSLLIADVAATLVVFIFSAVFGNSSVYDPYWSVAPIVIVIGLCCIQESFEIPMILATVAVLAWGVRLTWNWAYTFKNLDRENQDWRYTLLQEKTGGYYAFVNLFGIHLLPTLIVYSCMLPVLFTFEQAPAFNAGSAVFFALAILAVAFEWAADHSMHKFKKEDGEGFLRKGLWKYSRHPNYLGEISFWWAIALATVCVLPSYWWLIFGAVLNTLLFLFASIPMAEKHQARKQGYELYRKNTWKLFPIYKRQHEEPAEQPEEQPAEQPEEQPAEQPEEQPAEQPEEQPAEQPEEQPAEQPEEQPAEQPEEQPAEQPEEQPAEQPEEQPAEQPEEQPAEQP